MNMMHVLLAFTLSQDSGLDTDTRMLLLVLAGRAKTLSDVMALLLLLKGSKAGSSDVTDLRQKVDSLESASIECKDNLEESNKSVTELQNFLQETKTLASDVQSAHENLKDAFCHIYKNVDVMAGLADMTIEFSEVETYLRTFAEKMVTLDPQSSEKYQEQVNYIIEKLQAAYTKKPTDTSEKSAGNEENAVVKVKPEETRNTGVASTKGKTTKKTAAKKTSQKSK